MQLFYDLKRSVAAGLMIGVGGTVFLSCENKTVGAFFFSIALFTICALGLNLFTGKIGYIIETRNKPNCAVIWLGDLIGCALAAAAIRVAKPALAEKAHTMVEGKLALPWYSVLLLGFFCGILMYVAVENYKNNPHGSAKVAGILLCVTVFILCGFEHSIADMFYCILAVASPAEALRSFAFLLLVTLANAAGSMVFRAISK